MLRGQMGGSDIWLIRVAIAVLGIIFFPNWLANSPPNELLFRLAGVLIFVAVVFGRWAQNTISWIAKKFFGIRL